MASPAQQLRSSGPRKSILDLAPLELDCMNTLWPLGEGTVRQIQQCLAPYRPRAYTTIMTILDRLAHKCIVTRRKVGRAYLYRPNLSAQEARAHAVEQVVESFFAGSPEALAAHLAGVAGGTGPLPRRGTQSPRAEVPYPNSQAPAPSPEKASDSKSIENVDASTDRVEVLPATRLDESLL